MPRLYTLGRFELVERTPSGEQPVRVQPKRLALLGYLAAEPGASQRRDTLLGLLWPELGQDEARRALRQALHYLRRHVGEDAIATRSDDRVALTDVLWCDVVEFQRAVAEQRDEDALDLYRGDFLEGVFLSEVAPEFEEWLYRTRIRLRGEASGAARRLSGARQAAGDTQGAASAALLAHRLDPDDEVALRRALQLTAAAGDRARALAVYEAFARRLAEQFEVTPSAETVAFIERLRSETHFPTSTVGSPVISVDAPESLASGAGVEDHAPEPPPHLSPSPQVSELHRRGPPPRGTRKRVLLAAAIVLPLALGSAWLWRSHVAGAPGQLEASAAEPKRVLVADLADLAQDSLLTRALSEAVRVDLSQFPGIEVLTPQQIARALRLSEKTPTDFALNDSLARVLATREGVGAIVTGELARIGGRYTISARVAATEEGRLIASARESADSADLVEAVGRLTRSLRKELGESLRSLRTTPRLDRVTTPSLPALRKYTEAGAALDSGDRQLAIALLQEATAIDTAFADAYRFMGALYAALGDPGRAAAAQRRALAHRDRLTLYDRQLVMGSYHMNVTREYDKAIAAYRELLELFPKSKPGLNNLSMVYARTREYPRADTLLLELIAVDSTIPSVYLGLAQSYMNQGRFADSRRVLDEVASRFPDHPITPMTESYLAAAQQDWTAAEERIRVRLRRGIERNRPGEVMDAHLTLGQILLATGRLREAESELRAAMTVAAAENVPRRVLFSSVQLGWLELRYRQRPERALSVVDSALARYPLADIGSEDRPYAELTELLVALGEVDRARRVLRLAERDSAARPDLEGAAGAMMRGLIASAEGRFRTAAGELRAAQSRDTCPICALPALGEVYERGADPERALLAYERYLRTPWMWRFETDAPHLGWTMLRLADLYERHGRDAEAAEQYARLLRLWQKADPELQPVLERARAAAKIAGAAPT